MNQNFPTAGSNNFFFFEISFFTVIWNHIYFAPNVKDFYILVYLRRMLSCSGAGTFADQLTLFKPGRTDYPHLLLLAPPMFFTFQHHCKT